MKKLLIALAVVMTGVTILVLPSIAKAETVAEFYKGKDISLLIDSRPGPGYDFFGRLLAAHMGRHIPGHPRIVVKNMPGAGGMKCLNFAYNQGAHDGSMFFTLHTALPLQQALGQRGVRYDARQLISIGRIAAGNSVTAVWHTTGVKTLADLQGKSVAVGGSSATSNTTIFPIVAKRLLGAKFTVVVGYSGMHEVMLAMERGEIQGFGNFTLASLRSSYPDFLSKHLINPLIQWGFHSESVWKNIPLALDLAKTPVARKAIEVLLSEIELGRSYYLPPRVPKDRVAALRKAVKDTVNDPSFEKQAEKAHADIRYAAGPEMEKIIEDTVSAPKDAIELLKTAMVLSGNGRCNQYSNAKVCRKKKK